MHKPAYKQLELGGSRELEKEALEHTWMEAKINRYQFIAESAHNTIFFKDRNFIANTKSLEVSGLCKEKVIGKNDYKIMSNKEAKEKTHLVAILLMGNLNT